MIFELEARGHRSVRSVTDPAERRILKLGRNALNAKPALERIADELINVEERQFATGKGWRPNAPSTRERKRRQGADPLVMRETGRLDKAMTSPRRSRPKGRKLNIGKRELVFGIKGGRSPIYYARFHQKGDGVPKRVVIPKPTRRQRRRYAGIIREHLLRR